MSLRWLWVRIKNLPPDSATFRAVRAAAEEVAAAAEEAKTTRVFRGEIRPAGELMLDHAAKYGPRPEEEVTDDGR